MPFPFLAAIPALLAGAGGAAAGAGAAGAAGAGLGALGAGAAGAAGAGGLGALGAAGAGAGAAGLGALSSAAPAAAGASQAAGLAGLGAKGAGMAIPMSAPAHIPNAAAALGGTEAMAAKNAGMAGGTTLQNDAGGMNWLNSMINGAGGEDGWMKNLQGMSFGMQGDDGKGFFVNGPKKDDELFGNDESNDWMKAFSQLMRSTKDGSGGATANASPSRTLTNKAGTFTTGVGSSDPAPTKPRAEINSMYFR